MGIHLWAESKGRSYDFSHTDSLNAVRVSQKGDLYWFDSTTKTLYWRVIAGYVDTDISCPTDALTGAFCVEKPIFKVPSMNCPENEIMLSIDECGPICELENNCLKQCRENKEDKFFWKKKKGKNLIKSCKWLSKYKKKKQVCKKNVEHIPGYGAAQDICQATCSSCEACYENENSVIYLGQKKNEQFKTCKYLGKKSKKFIKKYCKRSKLKSSYKPPKEACPVTCSMGSCVEG